MGRKIVLTGGCGSGKSARAIEIARAANGFPEKVFIATAEPLDDEMKRKVEAHRRERGTDFKTVEEPFHLAGALEQFSQNSRCCAVVDCMTMWLSNLLQKTDEDEASAMKDDFVRRFERFRGLVIVVTNETGMGVIAPERETRLYAAGLAEINRRLVSACDEAYFLVAGMPLRLK